jgi:hypothetical protein
MYIGIYVMLGVIATLSACVTAWYACHRLTRRSDECSDRWQGVVHIDDLQLCCQDPFRFAPDSSKVIILQITEGRLGVADKNQSMRSAPFQYFATTDHGELLNR